ncbi:lysosomal phospholipase A and acyltransferase-like [Babylonia areolata]|uniref:lysosomal phospholipase A and acyltransferase-like n=1 Tax=Babylonia areolata TaxID=304850 RepID=UPI003FCF43E6
MGRVTAAVCWALLLAALSMKPTSSLEPKYPVLLVPGLGGSMLFSNYDTDDYPWDDCSLPSEYLWVNVGYAYWHPQCFLDSMQLVYDRATHTSSDLKGVNVTTKDFGTADTIMNLDPDSFIFTSYTAYYEPMVTMLASYNYTSSNVGGAPYDWRRAPNEMEKFYADLKAVIEDMYRRNGDSPVVVVGHSMGNPVLLYFYNQVVTRAWKNQFIRAHVSLAGVWGGAAKVLHLITAGYNMGFGQVSNLEIRPVERSMASINWLVPTDKFWGPEEALVITAKKNYTVSDLEQLYQDLNATDSLYMYRDTKDLIYDLKAPEVEVHCIYGYGVDTPAAFQFPKGAFPDTQPNTIYGDGDGTVNLRSLQGCLRWAGEQEQAVYHMPLSNVSHVDIISDPRVYKYLEWLLEI